METYYSKRNKLTLILQVKKVEKKLQNEQTNNYWVMSLIVCKRISVIHQYHPEVSLIKDKRFIRLILIVWHEFFRLVIYILVIKN